MRGKERDKKKGKEVRLGKKERTAKMTEGSSGRVFMRTKKLIKTKN